MRASKPLLDHLGSTCPRVMASKNISPKDICLAMWGFAQVDYYPELFCKQLPFQPLAFFNESSMQVGGLCWRGHLAG